MIERLVSIIIPIYNGNHYISSLIIDLNRQTYKTFEVIFIDDGSTDGTYQTLLSEKEKHNNNFNITIIRQKNSGVSVARNKGIREAKGEYLCFIDIDDGLSENYLSYMVKAISENEASLVFCKTSPKYLKKEEVYEVKNIGSSKDTLYRYLYHELISGACSLLVRNKILTDNNLMFEEGFKYSEDLHMVWRLIAFSNVIVELNNKLYIYKNNKSSAMSVFNKERITGILLIGSLSGFFCKKTPDFYQLFKKYAEARVAWSVLCQAAYFLNYSEFKDYIDSYNYIEACKLLFDYPQKYVALSSRIFICNKLLFYLIIKNLYIIKKV
ncbi:MAG TPA: hypothetical protein DCS12_02440 [Clostridiales bacterium]|nr:hypothetical protein [Clostridiales bacterium]